MFMYPTSLLVIENGIDRISIDRRELSRDLLSCGLSEESVMKMFVSIAEFAQQAKEGLQKGEHIGSTDLAAAVHSIFFTHGQNKNYADFGLKTDTELKLAAILVEKACQKEDRRLILGKINQGL